MQENFHLRFEFVEFRPISNMDIPDGVLSRNRDWDPGYLRELLQSDFYDFNELWSSNVNDEELVLETNRVEKYCPIIEDITIEDDILCDAVEKIEEE